MILEVKEKGDEEEPEQHVIIIHHHHHQSLSPTMLESAT